MGIDSVGRSPGQTVPQAATGEEKIESTQNTEKEMSPHVAAESTQDVATSESAAKHAKSKILESKSQEQQKQAELQTKLTNAQAPEGAERAERKQQIREKLDQVGDNLHTAMEARDQIRSHLSHVPKEIQQLRRDIHDLRKEMQKLNEEIRQGGGQVNDPSSPAGQKMQALKNMERSLETKIDHLIDQTAALVRGSLPGGGVSVDTSALRHASLETKLQGLEGLNRHLSDHLNGTGNGSFKVSVGGVNLTAKGLNDYIAKLQNLQAQLQTEDKKLGN